MAVSQNNASTIGANFSNYQGSPGLGGFGLGFGRIDTGAIGDLARYTLLFNKQMYDQSQADANERLLELAKLSEYDPADAIPEEVPEAQAAYANAVKAGRELADKDLTPMSPKDRVKALFDYKSKVKGEQDRLNMFKARNISYKARLEKINAMKDVAARNIEMKRLQDDIKRSKGQPLPLQPEVDLDFGKEPDVGSLTFDTFYQYPNKDFVVKLEIPNMKDLQAQASATSTLLKNKDIDVTSPDFLNLSPEQQKQKIFESDLRNVYRKNGWLAVSDEFNTFINQKDQNGNFLFKDQNGNLDQSKLSSAPGFMKGVIQSAQSYNESMKTFKDNIKSGKVLNKNGVPVGFLELGLAESDFSEININDGISPEEWVKMKGVAGWQSKSLRTINENPTDDAFQGRGLDLEAGRLSLQQEEFKLNKDKYADFVKGSETEKNAALAFAQNLFTDIAGIASFRAKGGGYILTPTDLTKMTTEQLKYLGVELPAQRDSDGNVTQSGGLQPLKLGKDEIIQLDPDGTVRVMSDAKPSTEGFRGKWDNTRSTSIWNAATNRLNEENVKSAGKERNAYFPIDMRGKEGVISLEKSGGEKTTTSSSSTPVVVDDSKLSDKDYYEKYKKFRKR